MHKTLKPRAVAGLFYHALFLEIYWIPEDDKAQSFDILPAVIQVLTLHNHAVLLSPRAFCVASCRILSADQFKADQLDKKQLSSATDRCLTVCIAPYLMLTLSLQLRTIWYLVTLAVFNFPLLIRTIHVSNLNKRFRHQLKQLIPNKIAPPLFSSLPWPWRLSFTGHFGLNDDLLGAWLDTLYLH